MGVFFRDSADFTGPPSQVNPGSILAGFVFGYTPIPINLTRLSLWWYNFGAFPTNAATVQPWVNGAFVGVQVNGGTRQDIDPVIAIPAVANANVDGAARFGWGVLPAAGLSHYSDASNVALAYDPANAADVGKEVMGFGADIGTARLPYVSPPQMWQGSPGFWNDGSGSATFMSPKPGVFGNVADWEISSSGAFDSQADGVASVPWCRPAVWDDFTIALRATAPGAYRYELRVNQTTVKTLDIDGSQRVFTFPGSISLNPGDLVCWMITVSAGTSVSGDILWTSRASVDAGALGGGESGGEY